jgi:Ca-activated chloride channel homolog
LPPEYSLIIGRSFYLGKSRMQSNRSKLYTSFIFQFQRERYYLDSIDLHLIEPSRIATWMVQYTRAPFLVGASLKNINDISYLSFQLGFNVFNMDFHYSYGFSAFSQQKTKLHQITLGYKFLNKVKARSKSSPMSIACPGFGGGSAYYYRTGKSISNGQSTIYQEPEGKGNVFQDTTDWNTEDYKRIYENSFLTVLDNPLSTFSIDVDNASYSNTRRFINQNQLPPADAVRIEEFINYFDYDYPKPTGNDPFSIMTELSACPWSKEHNLLHIGIKGKGLDYDKLNPSNLVFLIDVSGSMADSNKLPLIKESLYLLLDQLNEKDNVAIVVYASTTNLLLNSTSTTASEKGKIKKIIDGLIADGSTAGGQGIIDAYKEAKKNLIVGGNNRVILLTDGDFNTGASSDAEMIRLIEEKRKEDIYLTICGFGMGNYKDSKMEQIADAGNGNYFYIDDIKEAEKVFIKELRANMFTIAKDVKFQLEFNPLQVKAYRLIGYENRILSKEDFNDDKKDAGEIGPGATVTVLYEIIPEGIENDTLLPAKVDELRYQKIVTKTMLFKRDELLTLKLRYKQAKDTTSLLITKYLKEDEINQSSISDYFKFSAAVAQFGLLLRGSKYKGTSSFESVINLAEQAKGEDEEKADFIKMVKQAEELYMKKDPVKKE